MNIVVSNMLLYCLLVTLTGLSEVSARQVRQGPTDDEDDNRNTEGSGKTLLWLRQND